MDLLRPQDDRDVGRCDAAQRAGDGVRIGGVETDNVPGAVVRSQKLGGLVVRVGSLHADEHHIAAGKRGQREQDE